MFESIFISYSHKDQETVKLYITELKKRKFNIIYDETDMHPGSVLSDAIIDNINKSFCTIFFLSNTSVQSKWCYFEIEYLRKNYETNIEKDNYSKPLRGLIVIQLGAKSFRDYNRERDSYSKESQEYINGFYHLFINEELHILDSNCDKFNILQNSINEYYNIIQSNFKNNLDDEEIEENNQEYISENNELDEYNDIDYIKSNKFNKWFNDYRENYYNLGLTFLYGKNVEQNINKGLKYLLNAVELSSTKALNKLGEIYLTNKFGIKDEKKAIEYFTQALKKDDTSAICNLGKCYELGLGVDQDYNKAFEYYKLASDRNDKVGFYNLALLYKNGFGVEQDYNKLIEYLNKSIEQKYYKAYNSLGVAYLKGLGVEIDKEKAWKLIKISADFGYINAIMNMARHFNNNEDLEKKLIYINKGCEYNNQEAFYLMGETYLNNKENNKYEHNNLIKAKEYYELAINSFENNELIISKAFYKLGFVYIKLNDYSNAIDCLEKCIIMNKAFVSSAIDKICKIYKKLDDRDSFNKLIKAYKNIADNMQNIRMLKPIYNMLAKVYEEGIYVEKDLELSNELYKNSNNTTKKISILLHEKNDNYDDVIKLLKAIKARYNQYDTLNNKLVLDDSHDYKDGKYFYYGIGIDRNIEKALECWNSKPDNPESIFFKGLMLQNGDIFEKNFDEALKFFESVKDKEILCAIHLSKMYNEGNMVTKDDKKAFNLLYDYIDTIDRDSNNDGEANYLLGFYYSNGIGVNKDEIEGLTHYLISSYYGYPMAILYVSKYLFEHNEKFLAVKVLNPLIQKNDDNAKKLLKSYFK